MLTYGALEPRAQLSKCAGLVKGVIKGKPSAPAGLILCCIQLAFLEVQAHICVSKV